MNLQLIKDKYNFIIQSDCWSVTHDLRRGGCISAIAFPCGTGENILLAPITSSFGPFSEAREPSPAVKIGQETAGTITLRLQGRLLRKDRSSSGIEFIHIYEYTEDYIRQKQIYSCSMPIKWDCSPISLFSADLRPDFNTYGIRYSYRHKLFETARSWEKQLVINGVKWGKILPGISPLLDHHVPDYLCFLHEGVEGIEWFPDSQGPQWETRFAGEEGLARVQVWFEYEPKRIRLTIEPFFDWLKVRKPVLKGAYEFGSYIGLPRIRKRMRRKYFLADFNSNPWPADRQIESLARMGVNLFKLHNDYHASGRFWHDGVYPPYDCRGMRELYRVIRTARRCGMKVIPYFSLVELHPVSNAYKQHAHQWKRTVDEKGAIHHNYIGTGEFGAHMCLASGWRDYLKEYIQKVLRNLGFDGVYYDWCYSLYCNNRRHGGQEHLVNDELVDMIAWTRRLVGNDGVLITHQSSFPMMAIENMADAVVTLEEICGDNYFYRHVPATEDLGPHCAFVNSVQRLICPAIAFNADSHGMAELISACLPAGHLPYGDAKLYQAFKKYNLSEYVFFDYRHNLVQTSDPRVKAAIFVGPENSLVILANNSSSRIKSFKWSLALPDPGRNAFRALRDADFIQQIKRFGQNHADTLDPHGYLVRNIGLSCNFRR